MWKAPKGNCWRPFCFSLSKNSPLNPYFLCDVERPVYSVWPFCVELYNQVFWTFEKCYMTKKITFLGNFRIIKISQRILSDFSSFLRNQLKLPKKVQIVPLINVPHGAYIWTILMLKSCRHPFYAHLKIDAIFTLRMLSTQG